MIQPEIRNITVEDMRKYGFGSYLNGGGAFPNNDKHATPEDWVALAEKLYQASIDDSLDGSTSSTEAVFFSAEHALTKTPTNAPVTTFAIILFRIIYPRYFSVVLM